MTPTTTGPLVATDPERLAAHARSILACPAEAELVVDGVAAVVAEGEVLGLRDHHGSPTFSAPLEAELTRAAEAGLSALLTVTSGLGPRGAAERAHRLVVGGRLERRGEEACGCCAETRAVVGLRLDLLLLSHHDTGSEQQLRVPVEAFRAPRHHLNRGYLQRTVEHVNDHHHDELRRSVAQRTSTRLAEVLGARLTGLSRDGVVVDWIDGEGAHRTRLDFPRPARTPDELGTLLRSELHAGIC